MAFLALAAGCASLKLPFVRVRLVAIHALIERERLSKVPAGMTIATAHLDVRPQQGKFRPRVVELHRHAYVFPTAGVMAGFASCLEFSPVRIGMAVDAAIEFQAGEVYLVVRRRGNVALVAGHFHVQTGQGIFCFRVIELRSLLPVGEVVTPLAVRPQVSFMHVLVAGYAILREPKIRFR